MQWFFLFFLLSGFCSILYELIWLRLAMAQFAVTTPLVSIVLSVFMAGLGFGSWFAGRLVDRWRGKLQFPALRLYAVTELLIGISALLVPLELSWGRQLLEKLDNAHPLSAPAYYLAAGIWIALALVPWCTCMGATFPFAMFAIEEKHGNESRRSFSFLYLANVGGAVAGALVPPLLVELLGFRGTLRFGSVLNFVVATLAFALTLRTVADRAQDRKLEAPAHSQPAVSDKRRLLWFLFGTGVTSMAAEVVWIRLFTPSIGTMVYAFAMILAIYLCATYIGSFTYRRWLKSPELNHAVWGLLGFTTLLPLVLSDPRIHMAGTGRVFLGVLPFSAVLGYVTPLLLDRISAGDPHRAGSAYAINVVGCIVGPLLSGFVLLPAVGERVSLCLLALPWFVAGLVYGTGVPGVRVKLWQTRWVAASLVVAAVILLKSTNSFEQQFPKRELRRDYTATVIATGTGRDRHLLVNGVGMTGLTPITKMMAHLPLSMLGRKPENGLVICFGMGTTYRSMLSWDINATAVELVPSVPSVFSYFHEDGPQVLRSPKSHVVIDDGRFFLERTAGQYDVVTLDPPPPVEAAGSSLLYSKEFYAIVKRHLRPDGILQQWIPYGDPQVMSSVTKALKQSFPYVRSFVSVEGWGNHYLASMSPLPDISPSVLVSRMPAKAVADMLEWGPASSPEQQFALVLDHPVALESLIEKAPDINAMEDDRPVNEYYYLRRKRARLRKQWASFFEARK
jgi:predicted membrane-bound spermidine synthase